MFQYNQLTLKITFKTACLNSACSKFSEGNTHIWYGQHWKRHSQTQDVVEAGFL